MKPIAWHVLIVLTLLGVRSAAPAQAQTTGTCSPAEADAHLDVNNVRARIFNDGALFWKHDDPYVYEVPKGDSVHAVFNASFWVGGRVNGVLRVASPRYGGWEFWPGPLDDQGNPPEFCKRYDRLYEITRDDIVTYDATGHATENLTTWPWRLGAPVVDGDGDPNNYTLEGGDRPALIGDQMFWWIMNDVGNEHQASQTPPIGMEVHGTAFAYERHPPSPFSYTTFYRYRLHYKGAAPLEEAYIALFVDHDLGNFDDDYVGADTMLAMGFVYNSDNFDEGERGYGLNPPALGVVLLQGPMAIPDRRDNDRNGFVDEPGERYMMTAFTTAHVEVHEQRNGHTSYNSMRGLTLHGQSIREGGYGGGENGGEITTIMFAGDPVTAQFWSETNIDGQGTATGGFDQKMLIASGPFTMQPGDEQEVLFAFVWSRGDDYLDSVRQLKRDVAGIRDVAEQVLQPNVTFALPPSPVELEPVLGFAQNFPNPFSASTTIRYSVPQPMRVRLKVYDMLGREVATLVNEQQQGGIYEVPFEAGDLPNGVYFYRLQLDFLTFTKKMALIR